MSTASFSFKWVLWLLEKNICVGRESNPGQLLGRQLCSPLYHRRLCQPDVRLNQHLVTSVATMDWPWRLLETTLPSIMTPWRNGSASDSRSEGCVFESRRGQNFGTCVKSVCIVSGQRKKCSSSAVTRIRTWVTAATTQGPNH